MFRTLKRGVLPIAVAGVAGGLVGALLLSTRTEYVATTTLELLSEIKNSDQAATVRPPLPSEEVSILRSSSVRSSLAERLGVSENDASFSVSNPDNTGLLRLSATSSTRNEASRTLTELLDIYNDLRVQDFHIQIEQVRRPLIASIAEYRSRLKKTDAQIATLDGQPSATSDALIATASFLEQRISESGEVLRNYDASLERGPFRVLVEPGTTATGGAGTVSKVITGSAIAIAMAMAALLALERLRDRVRNRRDTHRFAPQLRLLGEVRRERSTVNGTTKDSEDLDRFYTSLDSALRGLRGRVVVVAPVSKGDASGFAAALADRANRSGLESLVTNGAQRRMHGEPDPSPETASFVVCRSVHDHADAAVASHGADAVVLVVQAGQTTRSELAAANDDVRLSGGCPTLLALLDVSDDDYRSAPSTFSA